MNRLVCEFTLNSYALNAIVENELLINLRDITLYCLNNHLQLRLTDTLNTEKENDFTLQVRIKRHCFKSDITIEQEKFILNEFCFQFGLASCTL